MIDIGILLWPSRTYPKLSSDLSSGLEPDEIQQGQGQGPAPGQEQSNAPVQAWGGPAGEQLFGEGPECPGGQQIDHEIAVYSGCQEGQWDPRMHQKECGQHV